MGAAQADQVYLLRRAIKGRVAGRQVIHLQHLETGQSQVLGFGFGRNPLHVVEGHSPTGGHCCAQCLEPVLSQFPRIPILKAEVGHAALDLLAHQVAQSPQIGF